MGDNESGDRKQSDIPLAVERLRSRREEKGISVRALAQRIGVSPSLVSQIETGKTNPSVGTLVAITTELDLSLAELFSDPAAPGTGGGDPASHPGSPVLRHADRLSFQLESGVSWDRLTPDGADEVDFLYAVYEVGGTSSPADAPMRHHGREYGLVLSGRLGAMVGFESYELEAGDSIVFNSDLPHRLWTIGEEPAVVVWTVIGRGAVSLSRSFNNRG
jgi:transcriptional regulator with XRE-family HTH domain